MLSGSICQARRSLPVQQLRSQIRWAPILKGITAFLRLIKRGLKRYPTGRWETGTASSDQLTASWQADMSHELSASTTQSKGQTMNIRILVLLTCALLAGGCASDKGTTSSAQQKQKDPEVGMTKDQILALYGKTDNV